MVGVGKGKVNERFGSAAGAEEAPTLVARAACSAFAKTILDEDQAQEDKEANQQDQDEVEAQMEDAHGGQSPPQRITRSMFKALGARENLFSLFVISLVEGA